MLVRRARDDESDRIADVFIPSFEGLAFLPRLHTEDDTRDWIRTVVLAEQEVWVAEVEGRVVGYAALSERTLEHLYVHPDFQGRGAGTALLEHAKRERPAGFRFWVFQKNERARRFYERHGCRLVQLTDGAGNEEREPDALYEWVPTRVARTGSAPHGAAGPG
jgi:ribosomal protein S18 acetylase RimI-like enzyme